MTAIPPELLPIAASPGFSVVHPPGEGAGFVFGLFLGPAAWLCFFLRPYLRTKFPSVENVMLLWALGVCMVLGIAVGGYTGPVIAHYFSQRH